MLALCRGSQVGALGSIPETAHCVNAHSYAAANAHVAMGCYQKSFTLMLQ